MNLTQNSVLLKVKKLLSVADKDSNAAIGETVNAMALAYKLLRKHHLSMSQVMTIDDGNKNNSELLELREEESVTFKANIVPKWMTDLIVAVNRITQTKTLIKRTPREESSYSDLKIIFIGDAIDVLTASELFNFLRRSVTKLSTKHQKEINGKFKQWRSFAEGCSDTILTRAKILDDKLNKELDRSLGLNQTAEDFEISNFELDDEDDDYEIVDDEEFEELIHNESALALYGQYCNTKYQKIAEYLENKEIEEEKVSSTTSKIDGESYVMGSEAGKDIPLKIAKQLKENR